MAIEWSSGRQQQLRAIITTRALPQTLVPLVDELARQIRRLTDSLTDEANALRAFFEQS